MRWVDVAGSPGVGKSTLCNPMWGNREVGWDGKLPPQHWQAFLDETTRLFELIRPHWSYVPALRMNNRSFRKMATVSRMQSAKPWPYIQTGFAQRGIGFGWRMHQMGIPLTEMHRWFELMPVSIGVVFLTARRETLIARNKARNKDDRSYQVPLQEEPRRIATEVLKSRGVPILEIDTEQSEESARRELTDFAGQEPFDGEAAGHRCEVEVRQPPPWWE